MSHRTFNRNNRSFKAIIFVVLCASAPFTHKLAAAETDKDLLRAHVSYLASDECEGRLTGTAGARRARDYIEAQFKQYELSPGGTMRGEVRSYQQSFRFPGTVTLGDKNALVVHRAEAQPHALVMHKEFVPLRFSESLSDMGKYSVVFAGYGIGDAKNGFDDYAGMEVKDKYVLVFRGEPETKEGKRIGKDTPDPHALPSVYADIFYKAATAREKGARALILMTGYRHTKETERAELIVFNHGSRNSAGLPIVQLLPSVAAGWFGGEEQLLALQQKIDQELKPASKSLDVKLELQIDVVRERGSCENVLGFFPGQDPQLKDEIVVIGAHYDHLGRGNEFSLADKDALGVQIHYGADDNASGTASLLELIRLFSLHRDKLKRTVWFMAFSGEELGTIGSHYLVQNPPPDFTIKNIAAMLNLDMVGRAKDNKLMITGTGTGTGFKELLDKINARYRFEIRPTEDGFGGSDHLQFTHAGVPVLFFFTGSHEDYHKPSDTVDKINFEDQRRITDLVFEAALQLTEQESRPAFIRIEPKPKPVMGMGGVRLGTLPDYAYEGEGMGIVGTRKDSPADKAGLIKGDIIVNLAGHGVKNIQDFMNALRQCRPGDEIEIVVVREGKELKLKATAEK